MGDENNKRSQYCEDYRTLILSHLFVSIFGIGALLLSAMMMSVPNTIAGKHLYAQILNVSMFSLLLAMQIFIIKNYYYLVKCRRKEKTVISQVYVFFSSGVFIILTILIQALKGPIYSMLMH